MLVGSWVPIWFVALLLEAESRRGCCVLSEQVEFNKTIFANPERGLAGYQPATPGLEGSCRTGYMCGVFMTT